MPATFPTRTHARAAGFVSPGEKIPYRGFLIHSCDVSGPHSFGYRFSLVVSLDEMQVGYEQHLEANGPALPYGSEYGSTESVWLSEDLNKLRQPGCFAVMFAPAVYQAGIDAAKRDIDAWYDTHHSAAELHCEWAQWRAETDARQAAKAQRRATARAARP